MKKQVISLIHWQGIAIEVIYTPVWFASISDETVVSHIAIRADERLPLTETGYRSMFFYQKKSKIWGRVEPVVEELLNEAAQKKAWKEYAKDRQQLKLF